MTSAQRAVIVGASHAGVQLATSLRQEGWAGSISLIGSEPGVPYQRPPLSKAYLHGRSGLDELVIRSPSLYAAQRIQLISAQALDLDRVARSVTLHDGRSVEYDWLAVCTGASPRKLAVPGASLAGVHYLRTSHDVEWIRSEATPGRRAVIIGGGYIGLETAASLRTLGLEVTVLEAADRVLQRVTAPELSAFFERIHESEGVHIRTAASVQGLGGDDRVREVVLANGSSVPADLVIVGIGVHPNTELASAAGLLVDDGVLIDSQARTSDPAVVAAGDCTSYEVMRYGRRMRLESVPSAVEQAKVAAATICGREKAIAALPWFWSDQYDLKLQIAGINTGYDEIVLSGDPTRDRDFACFYLQGGQLIAADCVNRPREFVMSKKAIAGHEMFDAAAFGVTSNFHAHETLTLATPGSVIYP